MRPDPTPTSTSGAPTGDLALRLAESADVPALERLIDRAVRQLSAGYYSPAVIDASLRYVFGPDTRLIADRTYFVVTAGEALVGAGGWGKRRKLFGGDQAKAGDEDPLLDPRREPARLRAFYVDPDWARRGIASRLVDACFADLAAHGFSSVELLATLPGEPLYRRFGFAPVVARDVPMPGGLMLPCVVMRRAVPPGERLEPAAVAPEAG